MVVQDEVVFDAEMRRILLWVKTLIWILMMANLFSVASHVNIQASGSALGEDKKPNNV